MSRKLAATTLSAALVVLIFAALPGAASASTACGKAPSANNVQATNVTCSEAKKVISKDIGDCHGMPCSFRKVGFKWSCSSYQSGLNVCKGKNATEKAKVTFKYAGGEHRRL